MRIDIRPPSSAQLSGFKATPGVLIISLTWTLPTTDPTYRAAQIWVNTVNDFETATLFNTVSSNFIDYSVKDEQTRYFWIRSVNQFGRADGAVTGPVSAKGALVTTANIGVFDLATANIINQLKVGNISGLGALATLSSVNGATQVTNLGDLAYANRIAANQVGAGTLAAGVIYSGTISADKINAGTLNAISINAGSGAFSVSGSTGRAFGNNMLVYGLQTEDWSGINGYGACYASSRRAGNPGMFATATSGHGVAAYGGSGYKAFYAESGGYGPFTGSHDVVWPVEQETIGEEGDIVVDVKCVARSSVSNTLFEVELSTKPNQKGVVGVLVEGSHLLSVGLPPAACITGEIERENDEDRPWREPTTSQEYEEIKFKYRLGTINAVGEGEINVCGENGNLERGDLIVSSSMPGKGMRQDDDLVRGYTVARAREDVIFSSPDEVKRVACIYLCG